MNFSALILSSLAVGLLAAPAEAATEWTAATAPTLLAQSNETESDRSLFAVCPGRGMVELYVGANEIVGKGKGDAVKLTVESDGKKATISGVSHASPDAEMTGGAELVAHLSPDDDFFKVLATGRPVKLTGSLRKPATWNDKGMAAAVKKFVKDCTPR